MLGFHSPSLKIAARMWLTHHTVYVVISAMCPDSKVQEPGDLDSGQAMTKTSSKDADIEVKRAG